LTTEQVHAWGWRLPFLGGIVLGGVGWWMRRGLVESPAFEQVVEAHGIARNPVGTVIRESTGNLAAPAWYIAAAALATTAVTFIATRPASPVLPRR
jgi:hypothetical protein